MGIDGVVPISTVAEIAGISIMFVWTALDLQSALP